MKIRVGLKAYDLVSLEHDSAIISSLNPLLVKGPSGEQLKLAAGSKFTVRSEGKYLLFEGSFSAKSFRCPSPARIAPLNQSSLVQVSFPTKQASVTKPAANYYGELEVAALQGKVVIVLSCDLENYVAGVLSSEIPNNYLPEAMKAQAVVARTYGINPRISHKKQGFTVCDSYLCCQSFRGSSLTLAPRQKEAISATSNQIIVYQDQPALALFCASAGGHTENYENCFSDPQTNDFPAKPIVYLKGVPEGNLPLGFPAEAALRQLFNMPIPETADAWSYNFRWKITLSEKALEKHMHHVIAALQKEPEFAPFIEPPISGMFGHIQRFQVNQRGISGIAMSMTIHTSYGPWTVKKELPIRSVFRNPEISLARLKSARMYFEQHWDHLGLLSKLIICGLGSGHGVGLAQTGAQGFASKGFSYKGILAHYYPGTKISAAPICLF